MRGICTTLAVLAVCSTWALADTWETMPLLGGALASDEVWDVQYDAPAGDLSVTSKGDMPAYEVVYAVGMNPNYYTDYVVRGLVSTEQGTESGFIMRGDLNTFSCYAAMVNFHTGGFHIIKIAGGAPVGNINVESGGIGDGFDQTGQYMLEFRAEGNELTAVLYDENNIAIATRTAVDNTYSEGAYGVLGFNGTSDGPMNMNFTGLQIVPEPTSLALLGSIGCLLALRRRRHA